jgi:hypothetical protein
MEMIKEELSNSNSNIIWYFMLRAADNFYSKHSHWPGLINLNIKAMMEKLT